jgi:hypothetical protein
MCRELGIVKSPASSDLSSRAVAHAGGAERRFMSPAGLDKLLFTIRGLLNSRREFAPGKNRFNRLVD